MLIILLVIAVVSMKLLMHALPVLKQAAADGFVKPVTSYESSGRNIEHLK